MTKTITLPNDIQVAVQKGSSGAFVATLEKYDAVTEGDTLIELFFNVNDLIYTIFEIPRKDQKNIEFVPSREARLDMVRIAEGSRRIEQNIQVSRFIRDESKNFTFHSA